MEPMLVQQALAAGLDPTTVTELGKLLQPPGLGRKPALRNHTPAPVAAEVEESASSDEEEEGGGQKGLDRARRYREQCSASQRSSRACEKSRRAAKERV